MLFQAILCVSVPQARRADVDGTGKWQPRALSVHGGWGEWDILLSHPEPCLEGQKDTMEGYCALQELLLLERQHLSRVFCRALLIAGGWWCQGFGGLFPTTTKQQSSAWLSSGLFLFVFPHHLQPVTVSGLASPPWWPVSAFSQRADFLPCSSRLPLALAFTHPSPSIPQNQQMERSVVHTERRQETPREIYEKPSTSCAHDCREVCVPSLLP